MSRRGAIVVVAAAALLAGAIALRERGETLALNGLSVGVPAGWRGESFVNPSGLSVVRVGSFAFPRRPDDDVGQIARAQMRPGDVLVNIVDVTAAEPGNENGYYRPIAAPLAVDGSEAMQQKGYTVPAAVIRGVRLYGHNLYVSVSFGTAPPSPAQVAAANAVLRTLRPR
ncbi:MAG: hypothetical protein M3321_06460 [Actinomycetota bacterium]|nr:hypothetical protein [Actinomycetota bacterium]